MTMFPFPDNPVWQALSGRQKHLNYGDERLKYFREDVSPFIGLENLDRHEVEELKERIPFGRKLSAMADQEIYMPETFQVIFSCILYQMVYRKAHETVHEGFTIIPLHAEHIPAMLQLTAMTKPGPFYRNTISLGNYYGIFQNGHLAAMAGERLKPSGFTEISAICTHPDQTGKGYASALTSYVARQIIAEGNTPFLHVKKDNLRAISVYQRAGFEVRKEMYFTIFTK